MTFAADTATVDAALLAVSVLMVLAGTLARRVSFRAQICPVCHHTRATCTCRWR